MHAGSGARVVSILLSGAAAARRKFAMTFRCFLPLVLLAANAGAVFAQPGGGPPPALVSIDAARMERVEARREVLGEIRAVRHASLAAEEAGLVLEVAVESGDWVESGALLARLDGRLRTLDLERRRAARQSAEALVEERRAQVDKAERDLSRLKSLMTSAGASRNEVDDAETRLKEESARHVWAVAALASAKSEEATAEKRLADMTIKAPFTGSVVRKLIEVGEWVDEGKPVVELVAIDSVDAILEVPERFLGALSSPGASVELRVPALSRTISAPVTSVIAAGDRLARTFPVRVRLDNSPKGAGGGSLRPGMSVIALIPTGEPMEALTIHKDAVMRNDAGSYVYFNAGGSAAVAPIEPLFAAGERVVVRSPMLRDGMEIITQGNERVFPGQPLNILPGTAREGKGG